MLTLCIQWETLTTGFLAFVVAIFVACIAKQQYRISKQNLKLALYEKRFNVYYEVKRLLEKIRESGGIDVIIDYQPFNNATQDRIFLFDKVFCQYIEKIIDKAFKIKYVMEDLKDLVRFPVNSQEREVKVNELKILIKWFASEYNTLDTKFFKYLDFTKVL